MLWGLDVSCNESNQIKSNQSFYDVVGCDAAIKIKVSTVWKDDCSYIGWWRCFVRLFSMKSSKSSRWSHNLQRKHRSFVLCAFKIQIGSYDFNKLEEFISGCKCRGLRSNRKIVMYPKARRVKWPAITAAVWAAERLSVRHTRRW